MTGISLKVKIYGVWADCAVQSGFHGAIIHFLLLMLLSDRTAERFKRRLHLDQSLVPKLLIPLVNGYTCHSMQANLNLPLGIWKLRMRVIG